MKTLVYSLLLLIAAPGACLSANEDKALHFGVSLGAAGIANITCKEFILNERDRPLCNVLAAGTVLGAGLAKELLLDKHNSSKEHGYDMLSNGLGAAVGVGLTW